MRVKTKEIYDDLQRKLISAVYPPGEKLKPSELQEQYGCSANTVRDVLLRLSRVGIVEFELQRGFRARKTSPEHRNDVTRFRILLEQTGAELSMARGGLEWEASLTAAHHKQRHIEQQLAERPPSGPDIALWSDAELGFHETLLSACGSPILRETHRNVYAQFRQQMVGVQRDFGRNYFEAIIAEHQAILDAALARDAEACRTAIYDHLKRNIWGEALTA